MGNCHVIAAAAIKGGVGKSQISFQLAVRFAQDGKKVLLVDCDTQEVSYFYTQLRNETDEVKFDCIRLLGLDVRKTILRVKKNYDVVLVDVGASDSESLRAATSVCDIVLSPVEPASESIRSLKKNLMPVLEEMKEVNPRLRTYTFLNQSPSTGQDEAITEKHLKELKGINHIECPLRLRIAFKNSVALGKGIGEMKGRFKDKKAILEFESLYKNIKKILN